MKRTRTDPDARARQAFTHLCVGAGVLLMAFLFTYMPLGVGLPSVPHALRIVVATLIVFGLLLLRLAVVLVRRDFGKHRK
jgi:hypothetical protein